MIRKIRFKASGTRKIVRTCPAGQIFKSGRCIVQSAADKLMRRRSAKKMRLTKRKRQAKQKLGIIAMKKATRRRSAAGL
jgi:hypothetical protein